jgi:hypothetical protein
VGRYKLNAVHSRSLKAPGFNPCAYKVKNWFSEFAFQMSQLVPLHHGETTTTMTGRSFASTGSRS